MRRGWFVLVLFAGGCASDGPAHPLAGVWENRDSRRTYDDDDCSYTAVVGDVIREGYWVTGVDREGTPRLVHGGGGGEWVPGCVDDSQAGGGVPYALDGDRLLIGGMQGSREVAPGSHWGSSESSPGGGGSCSTIAASRSISLGETDASLTTSSCCLPASMCTMGTTSGPWMPTTGGFTVTWDQITYDYAVLGGLLADAKQVLVRVDRVTPSR